MLEPPTPEDVSKTYASMTSAEFRKYLIEVDISNFLSSLEKLYKERGHGVRFSPSEAVSRLKTLYWKVEPVLNRHLKDDESKELNGIIHMSQPRIEDIEKAFTFINRTLDEVGVTRVDNRTRLPKNLVKRLHIHLGGEDVE